MDTYELFDGLAGIFGPSGQENAVAKTIAKLAQPYADEISTDTLGNLIVHKKGSGAKLMVVAHMDSIGLIATYLEVDGTIRFRNVGGVQPKEIRNASVRFQNGTMGAVKVCGDADEDKLTLDDLYLDIGVSSREEAQALVRVGDVAVYANAPVKAGNRIIAPYLDNRISCAILLQALARIQNPQYDLYFVFTVQEELGLRGAKTAAYGVNPDYAVAVDVTAAYDYPGAPKNGSAILGGGAAIKVMDHSVICHPEMVEKLSRLAEEKKIKAQLDVLTRGGTDAGAIHQSRAGVITGGVSVPCRYPHTPTAVSDLGDVAACIDLVVSLIKNK